MIFRALLFTGFFCVLMGNTMAQTVTVRGSAPDYAGMEFRFCTYSDYITYTEDELFRCPVDSGGNFSCTGMMDHEGMIFARAGIYFIYFYASPGSDYVLHLPPFQDKTPLDSINLYFEEAPVHAGILTTNPNDMNRLIAEGRDSAATHAGYASYVRYRKGLEKYRSVRQKVKNLSVDYFYRQPVLYHNEAYMDLFNQVYNRYFEFAQNADMRLSSIINSRQGLASIKSYLLADSTFLDDALLELVMLKNLYDNFYTTLFSREGLLSLVKEIESTSMYPMHRIIARNIIRQVIMLIPGQAPPDFELYDTEGQLHRLSDFKGKALYLIFCKVFNYNSIRAFEQLVTLYNVYHDIVEVAVVSLDDDLSRLKQFRDQERYRWIFLHYGNNMDLLRNYNIKVLPVYFLFDKEGKLLLSPAPSPLSDVENIFIKLQAEEDRP